MAVTHTSGLMVGARSFAGNPYDGHTLSSQLEQTGILLQDLNVPAPKVVVVDLGYRGHDVPAGVEVIHRGRYQSLTRQQKTWLRRRQAVEPAIGHAKSENRLGRCFLKGALGDAMNAVLAACGYNLRWLLRQIARLGIQAVFLRLAIMTWLQRFWGRPILSPC
ncbi:transposase (fragment) [Thiomonas sp. X19]